MDQKDLHNIDRMFSDHFQGKEVPVRDKEQMWQNIQNRRKRKSGLYWSLGGILLLCLTVFAWMQWQPTASLDHKMSVNEKTEIKAVLGEDVNGANNQEKVENSVYTNAATAIPAEASSSSKGIKKAVLSERDIAAYETNKKEPADKGESNGFSPLLEQEAEERTDDLSSIVSTIPKLSTQVLKPIEGTEFRNREIKSHNFMLGPDWDKCWVRPNGRWFIDAYAQFGMPMESIQNLGESANYASEWASQFDPAYSYHGGLLIGRQFHWNGYLAAGIEYQQFQTAHLNELRIIETIEIYDPRAYYTLDENGERQYVGDTVTVTNIRDEVERSANNYKMLHLPIHIGYRSNGKDWRYGIDFSALINLSLGYEGVFLRADGAVVEVDQNNQSDFFAEGIGTSFSAALHLGRLVGDRTEIYLQPRFRLNRQSYLNEDAGLSIERNFAGLRAGLIYYLE